MLVKAAFVAAFVSLAAPAMGQVATPPTSGILKGVAGCRSQVDPLERLACYDREVAALEAAEASREVIIYDRQQLQRARRSVFGLTLPDLNIFGGGSDEESTRLTSTIRTISSTPYGKWIFELEDGARWIQTDSKELAADPRVGQTIVIRRAAMGSYLANVNNQVAIRVQRVR